MTDVFDLLETQLCFPGVDSDLISAKTLGHSSCVGEEVWVDFAMYEYIVDVYFAYLVDQAVISKGQLLSVHWYRPPTAQKAVSTRDVGCRRV